MKFTHIIIASLGIACGTGNAVTLSDIEQKHLSDRTGKFYERARALEEQAQELYTKVIPAKNQLADLEERFAGVWTKFHSSYRCHEGGLPDISDLPLEERERFNNELTQLQLMKRQVVIAREKYDYYQTIRDELKDKASFYGRCATELERMYKMKKLAEMRLIDRPVNWRVYSRPDAFVKNVLNVDGRIEFQDAPYTHGHFESYEPAERQRLARLMESVFGQADFSPEGNPLTIAASGKHAFEEFCAEFIRRYQTVRAGLSALNAKRAKNTARYLESQDANPRNRECLFDMSMLGKALTKAVPVPLAIGRSRDNYLQFEEISANDYRNGIDALYAQKTITLQKRIRVLEEEGELLNNARDALAMVYETIRNNMYQLGA